MAQPNNNRDEQHGTDGKSYQLKQVDVDEKYESKVDSNLDAAPKDPNNEIEMGPATESAPISAL